MFVDILGPYSTGCTVFSTSYVVKRRSIPYSTLPGSYTAFCRHSPAVMATITKPTLLIVGGAWHQPSSYTKLTTALRAAGFEVHLPALPSNNQTRPPNGDLFTDSDLIRSYATNLVEAGHMVAVLMHSYGGQVGTNALHGLSQASRAATGKGLGGISHLTYMTAFVPFEGKSTSDKVAEMGGTMSESDMAEAFDMAEDGTLVPNFPKEGMVGVPYASNVDPGELKAWMDSLVRWNGKSWGQGIENTPAWRDGLKLSYIYTTGDVSVQLPYQRNMVAALEKEGKTVDTVEIDTGHSPHLTATKEVVDAVIRFTSW